MKLLLTVTDGGRTKDLSFDVQEGATVGDVARASLGLDDPSTAPPYTLTSHAGALLESQPLVQSGLRNGARVRLTPSAQVGQRAAVPAAVAKLTWTDDSGRQVRSFSLQAGENTVGRSSGCTVQIDHPSVSRIHFRINVGDRIELVDLQSANGVNVDGAKVHSSLTLGQRATIQAGHVTLVFTLEAAARDASSLGSQGGGAGNIDGGLVAYYNRPPRVEPRYKGKNVKAPQPPDRPEAETFSWLPAMVPLVMAGVLFVVSKGSNIGVIVAFSLMSPLMMFGSWWQSRSNARKKFERLVAAFRQDVAALEAAVYNEQQTETLARRTQAPATPELIVKAAGMAPELWSRGIEDEDFLLVRIGEGDQPSVVQIEVPDGGDRVERAAIENLPTRFGTVANVPVEANLKTGGVGFAGSAEFARAAVRSFVAQITALHSPAEVAVAALLSEEEGPNYDWLKWLPHTRSPLSPLKGEHVAATPSACADLLRRLENVSAKRGATDHDGSDRVDVSSWIVLLVDNRARLERPVLDALLRRGPHVGITFVWVATSASQLSRRCKAVVAVDPYNPVLRFTLTGAGESQQGVAADLLGAPDAEGFARGISSFQDASARTAGELDLPAVVLLSELLGGESVLSAPHQVQAKWDANALQHRTLKAPIGQAPGEEFSVDIVRQGPHGFLIGTTGSGKSEMLRTLLVSLAATYGPEKVNFLLIDFKGGAALKPFLNLPHTIGLVTNLAEGESNAEAKLEAKVRRTIVWLRAELQRRMTILDDAGYSDISDMEKAQVVGTPPRLLIVADEFAVLAANKSSSTADDVTDEIVNIARLGRSLGIHLLLATQRAAGVITDNIRANTNLRIALRVQDVSESTDVVGSPLAAKIALTTPGRAFVSFGSGSLTEVQTASSTGHTSALRLLPKVRCEEFTFLGRAPTAALIPTLPGAPGDNDLTQLVRTIGTATSLRSVPIPDPHWAEPPAELVPLASVPNEPDPFVVTLGLLDEPDQQRVSPANVDLSEVGSMLVFGAGRAGKTVLLRTAAASLAQRIPPEDLHLVGLDCAGRGLESLDALPQSVAMVNGDSVELVYRLFRLLRRTIDRRVERFAEAGVADLREYRARHPHGDDRHLVVVFFDGLLGFVEQYNNIDNGLLVDRLSGLILDGRAAGVHFIITANRRGGIPMPVMSAISCQIVMRMANPDDYGMLDIKADQIPIEPPAGRGIFGKFEFQAALVTDAAHAEASHRALVAHDDESFQTVLLSAQQGEMQTQAITALGTWLRNGGWELPATDRLRALPARVHPQHLLPANNTPWTATIGLGESQLLPAVLSMVDNHAVVTGPPRSGKSFALAAIAESMRASTPGLQTLLIAARPSTASSLGCWTETVFNEFDASDRLQHLTEQIEATSNQPTLVCFDDFAEMNDAVIGEAFNTVYNAARRGAAVRFVVASEPRALQSIYNDAAKAVRRYRTGLLLQPDIDSDGELLNARLPRQFWREFPAGRGYLVQGSTLELIQVSHPGD